MLSSGLQSPPVSPERPAANLAQTDRPSFAWARRRVKLERPNRSHVDPDGVLHSPVAEFGV